MNPDVLEYRLDCPNTKKEVSPTTCQKCESKRVCEQVQKLGDFRDLEKLKGTILGGGVNQIIDFRKEVMKFIIG